MFATLPEFELPPGTAPTAEGARHWRGVAVVGDGAWFIMHMRLQSPAGTPLLPLLIGDSDDVVEAIKQFEPDCVESLVCILPADGDQQGDRFVRLTEIWTQYDACHPNNSSVFFRDERGACRTGTLAATEDLSTAGARLMARVGNNGQSISLQFAFLRCLYRDAHEWAWQFGQRSNSRASLCSPTISNQAGRMHAGRQRAIHVGRQSFANHHDLRQRQAQSITKPPAAATENVCSRLDASSFMARIIA